MSHKKNVPNLEQINCEKYLNRLMKDKPMTRKQTSPSAYQDKVSSLSKQQPNSSLQRLKPKSTSRQASPEITPRPSLGLSPDRRLTPTISPDRRLTQAVSPDRKREQSSLDGKIQISVRRKRSVSSGGGSDREPWGQLLKTHKSREKVSTFCKFDPLRTLHFLSKELQFRLQNVLPGELEVHQMIRDIQYALKRIPPEVASSIHLQQISEVIIPVKPSTKSLNDEVAEKQPKPTSTKTCQTPPTLYQEDTEKFQRIMDENAQKLEISCKQLENVCLTLQTEKEMTERELEQTKRNMEMLVKRLQELEAENDDLRNDKVRLLEEENDKLRKQLEKMENNPSTNHLIKIIEDLRTEKTNSDQTCAKLEYEMTLLGMEKEKFVTMLAIRDKEIKEIQEEMSRIQDQVSKELRRLNGEVLSRASSLNKISPSKSSDRVQENKENFTGIGDATTFVPQSAVKDMVVKETGDAGVSAVQKDSQESILDRIRNGNYGIAKDEDSILEELLNEMVPSSKV